MTKRNSVIQIPEGEVEPEVDTPESLLKKLTEGLLRDFTGLVLRSDVPVEILIPREEGMLGWVVIELKPDARACKSYPIHLVVRKKRGHGGTSPRMGSPGQGREWAG